MGFVLLAVTISCYESVAKVKGTCKVVNKSITERAFLYSTCKYNRKKLQVKTVCMRDY